MARRWPVSEWRVALSSQLRLSLDELQYAMHHAFLPPRLPETGDNAQTLAYGEIHLPITSNSIRKFRFYVEPGATDAIATG